MAADRVRVVRPPERPWKSPRAMTGEVDDGELIVVHVDLLAILPSCRDQLQRILDPFVRMVPVPCKACNLATLE